MVKTPEKQRETGNQPFLFHYEFAERFDDAPEEIHVLPVGKWSHPVYGEFALTQEDIREFVENFQKGIRNRLPITAGHDTFKETEAVGWFKELIDRGAQGLFATVEWTERGEELLRTRAFRYFSAEYVPIYEDPKTLEKHRNVLVGGALTNKPFMRELEPVVFSENGIINNNNNIEDMNLEELMRKDVSALTDAEKAFIREHKNELSDDQKAQFSDVVGEPAPEPTPEENPAPEPQQHSDANQGVRLSAEQYAALKVAADKGQQAFAELERQQIETAVTKLTLSEGNKAGRFLSKDKDDLSKFVTSLSEDQRTAFSELVSKIPAQTVIFGEVGDDGDNGGGSAGDRANRMAKELATSEKIEYVDALQRVFTENPELRKEYQQEQYSVN